MATGVGPCRVRMEARLRELGARGRGSRRGAAPTGGDTHPPRRLRLGLESTATKRPTGSEHRVRLSRSDPCGAAAHVEPPLGVSARRPGGYSPE